MSSRSRKSLSAPRLGPVTPVSSASLEASNGSLQASSCALAVRSLSLLVTSGVRHAGHASTSDEMGTCHYMLGYQEPAQALVDEARRLDPECEEALWIAAAE